METKIEYQPNYFFHCTLVQAIFNKKRKKYVQFYYFSNQKFYKSEKINDLKKIKVFKLQKFKNSKGNVLRGFRKNDKFLKNSAEIYFSWINKNAIKGWKLHKNDNGSSCTYWQGKICILQRKF